MKELMNKIHTIDLNLEGFDTEFIKCEYIMHFNFRYDEVQPWDMVFKNSKGNTITNELRSIGLLPTCIQYVRDNFTVDHE